MQPTSNEKTAVESDNVLRMERLTRLKESGIGVVADNEVNENDSALFFVRIPSEASEPLEQLTVDRKETKTIEPLLEPYFELYTGESVDMALLQEHVTAVREAGCTTGMCPHISQDTLRRAAEVGTIESIKLVVQGSAKYVVYYDESAPWKRRSRNEQANQFIATASSSMVPDSSPPPILYGDVFVIKLALPASQSTTETSTSRPDYVSLVVGKDDFFK